MRETTSSSDHTANHVNLRKAAGCIGGGLTLPKLHLATLTLLLFLSDIQLLFSSFEYCVSLFTILAVVSDVFVLCSG